MITDTSFIVRFWHKVHKTDDCWIWNGCRDRQGYGKVGKNGKTIRANRASYEIVNGDIPTGMCVLHSCDNPACVHPDHLFLGTRKHNAEDRTRKHRSACGTRNGAHTQNENMPRGEKHANSKLNSHAVIDIRTSKLSLAKLGRKYGVAPSVIRDVRIGATWKHVILPD